MSLATQRWAETINFPGMRHSERILLRALADYATEHGNAWPRIETLVRKTGLNRRTIQVARARLVAQHLVACHEDSRGGVVNYALNLRWCPATANRTANLCEKPGELDCESAPPDCAQDSQYCESDSQSPLTKRVNCESDSHQVESVKKEPKESTKQHPSSGGGGETESSPARAPVPAYAPASAPPAAARPQPRGVGGDGPAEPPASAATPDRRRLTGDALVSAMVAIWNETVRGSPLRGQRGKLHPELAQVLLELVGETTDLDLGDLSVWRQYCRAATQDAHLRGDNNGPEFAEWTGNLEHAIRPRAVRRLTAQLQAAHARAQLDARDALFAAEQAESIAQAKAQFPDFDPKAAGSPLWQQAQADEARGDSTLMDILRKIAHGATLEGQEERWANHAATAGPVEEGDGEWVC